MNEIVENKLELSSRKRRIAAFLIDHFLLSFLMTSIIFLALGPNFMDEGNMVKIGGTIMYAMLPLILLYLTKDSVKGISAGRLIMGIMVRDAIDPNNTPSFWRLILRNLLLVFWFVEFIVLAISKSKKRLGDLAADTIVVRNPNKHLLLPKILILSGIGISFFLFITLFVSSAIKGSNAYKITIQNIELNEEIRSETGGITGYGMIPTGNINITNGYGDAQLEITVKGNDKDVCVSAHLTKEPNHDWELIEMNN